MANYGVWQGLEKATGNMAATGMGLLQYQAQREDAANRLGVEQDRLKLAQEQGEREKKAFEYDQKKKQETDALENIPIPLSMAIGHHSMRKSFVSNAVEWAKKEGLNVTVREDGEVFAPPKVYKAFKEAVKTNNELKLSVVESNLLDLQVYSQQLDAKIREGKGKPEEIESWRKQKSAADKSWGQQLAAKELAIEAGKGGGKQTALQEKIDEYRLAYPGISTEDARKLALGSVQIVTDPVLGTSMLVDKGTGETRPISDPTLEPETTDSPDLPENKRDIDLYKATEKGTGLYSAILNAVSVASSAIGGPIAKETVKARQELTMAQRNLFRALRESSKVLAFEMKTIFEEHPIDPNILRSPLIAQANLEVIDSAIRNRLADANRTIADPSLPASDRKDARSLAKAMGDFLEILNVPQTGLAAGTVEDGYKFKGGDPSDPTNWEQVK